MTDEILAALMNLIALVPSAEQLQALEAAAPSAAALTALLELKHLPEPLRNAIEAVWTPERIAALKTVRATVQRLEKVPVRLDAPDETVNAVAACAPADATKQIAAAMLDANALATLAKLGASTAVDAPWTDACCTNEQLAWMKRAVLPAAIRKQLAAAVLTPDQRERLAKAKLAPELIARIEASHPDPAVVKRADELAARVDEIELAMLSAADRTRIDAAIPTDGKEREAWINLPSDGRFARIAKLAAQLADDAKEAGHV